MPDVPHLLPAIRAQRAGRLRRLAAFAARQHGVLAEWQLLALGFSLSAIDRLVQNGQLHRVYRGVYAVGHRALSSKGRLMAAALAGGPDALISHRSAAALHGLLDDSRAVIDVVSPTHRRSRKGLRFHQSRHLDRAEVNGIPVTSVARTLLDIAPVVPKRRLVYALERAEKQREFDLMAIEAVMVRCHGHKGLKRLRQALREIDPEAQYAHEGLERRFIAFCKHYGLRKPAMNAVVEGLTVDALWARQKLIVELDSWEHHKERRAFEEDRRRDAVLALAGFQVLRVTDRQLTKELAETIQALLSRS
jgi:very-short-patch-repair endonuclease